MAVKTPFVPEEFTKFVIFYWDKKSDKIGKLGTTVLKDITVSIIETYILCWICNTGIYVQYHRLNQIQTDKTCFKLIGRASHTVNMSVHYIVP